MLPWLVTVTGKFRLPIVQLSHNVFTVGICSWLKHSTIFPDFLAIFILLSSQQQQLSYAGFSHLHSCGHRWDDFLNKKEKKLYRQKSSLNKGKWRIVWKILSLKYFIQDSKQNFFFSQVHFLNNWLDVKESSRNPLKHIPTLFWTGFLFWFLCLFCWCFCLFCWCFYVFFVGVFMSFLLVFLCCF